MLLMRFAFVAMKNTHNFIRECKFSFRKLYERNTLAEYGKTTAFVVQLEFFLVLKTHIKAKHKINTEIIMIRNHTTTFV